MPRIINFKSPDIRSSCCSTLRRTSKNYAAGHHGPALENPTTARRRQTSSHHQSKFYQSVSSLPLLPLLNHGNHTKKVSQKHNMTTLRPRAKIRNGEHRLSNGNEKDVPRVINFKSPCINNKVDAKWRVGKFSCSKAANCNANEKKSEAVFPAKYTDEIAPQSSTKHQLKSIKKNLTKILETSSEDEQSVSINHISQRKPKKTRIGKTDVHVGSIGNTSPRLLATKNRHEGMSIHIQSSWEMSRSDEEKSECTERSRNVKKQISTLKVINRNKLCLSLSHEFDKCSLGVENSDNTEVDDNKSPEVDDRTMEDDEVDDLCVHEEIAARIDFQGSHISPSRSSFETKKGDFSYSDDESAFEVTSKYAEKCKEGALVVKNGEHKASGFRKRSVHSVKEQKCEHQGYENFESRENPTHERGQNTTTRAKVENVLTNYDLRWDSDSDITATVVFKRRNENEKKEADDVADRPKSRTRPTKKKKSGLNSLHNHHKCLGVDSPERSDAKSESSEEDHSPQKAGCADEEIHKNGPNNEPLTSTKRKTFRGPRHYLDSVNDFREKVWERRKRRISEQTRKKLLSSNGGGSPFVEFAQRREDESRTCLDEIDDGDDDVVVFGDGGDVEDVDDVVSSSGSRERRSRNNNNNNRATSTERSRRGPNPLLFLAQEEGAVDDVESCSTNNSVYNNSLRIRRAPYRY